MFIKSGRKRVEGFKSKGWVGFGNGWVVGIGVGNRCVREDDVRSVVFYMFDVCGVLVVDICRVGGEEEVLCFFLVDFGWERFVYMSEYVCEG